MSLFEHDHSRHEPRVTKIIDDYAATDEPETASTRDSRLPLGFRFVKVHQADGSSSTVRRSERTWHSTGNISEGSTASFSSDVTSQRPGHRMVISRDANGRFSSVRRPIRPEGEGVETLRRISSRSRGTTAPRRTNTGSRRRSSSIPTQRTRDTLGSTITDLENTLMEQEEHYQWSIYFDNFSDDHDTPENIYSESEYDDEHHHQPDNAVFDARTTLLGSPYPASVRDTVAEPHPSRPLTPVYQSRRTREPQRFHSTSGWQHGLDRARDQTKINKRRQLVGRVSKFSVYFMAIVGTLLPLLFLILSIFLIGMNGKKVSSGWGSMQGAIRAAISIWPVAFAAVVAQCLKTWAVYQAERDGGSLMRHRSLDGRRRRKFRIQRLDVVCLYAFLLWCTSALGSQALQRVYSVARELHQDQVDVFYLDQNGPNQVWSPAAAGNTSDTSRAELVDVVAAYYVSILLAGQNSSSAGRSPRALIDFAGSNDLVSGLGIPIALPPMNSTTTTNTSGLAVGPPVETYAFALTTSYFNFTCGDWSAQTRDQLDSDASMNMSWSASSTLGLGMAASIDGASDAGVRFASLNNELLLSTSANDSSSSSAPSYSVIDCRYDQVFANRSVVCERGAGTGAAASCAQSGGPEPLDDLTGLAGTSLADFSADFVTLGNPTTKDSPSTATERYIQNPGRQDASDSDDSPVSLSSTTSPEDFARRYAYLFNTWVGLGYCPQCLAVPGGGDDSSQALGEGGSLSSYYRTAPAQCRRAGDAVFAVDAAWLAVYTTSAVLLLVAGVAAVFVSTAAAPGARRDARLSKRRHGYQRSVDSARSGMTSKSGMIPMVLPAARF